jgi:hypothetical protein
MVPFETEDTTDDMTNMKRLVQAEKQIIQLEFPNVADRNAVWAVLLEHDNKAEFSDPSKTVLFARPQASV